jgi:hypothetical protein
MCQRVECPTCGKPTWAGCGLHIEQALSGVPKDQRCRCDEQPPALEPAPPLSLPQTLPSSPRRSKSFIDRLFGR